MAGAAVDKLRIVMYPWLAFGHINPFFKLAKLIAQKGHFITFVSTPKNIDRLPNLPPNLASHIEFVKLPLPKVENLPENAESTADVPLNLIQYLKKANDSLREHLVRFLESSKPDAIIFDFCSYWVGPIASEMGIKSSFFCTFNAAAMAFMGSPSEIMGVDNPVRNKPEDLTVPPPWIPFPTAVAYHRHDVNGVMQIQLENDSGVSDGYRTGMSIRNCDVVTIRSSYEFEAEWLQVLETIYGKPVFPVGELPTYDDGDENDDAWLRVKCWLDNQSKNTVVYVAFGTEARMNQQQVTEIALGLERSEVPFFWVLGNRGGFQLPDGFEERTRGGRGVVWNGWAPQAKILAHESVGGFWTHGGLSSVVEGIQNGKPLVLLTFQLDQGLNARLLEEKKLGYSIPRDENDGSFTSDGVNAEARRIETRDLEDNYFLKKRKRGNYEGNSIVHGSLARGSNKLQTQRLSLLEAFASSTKSATSVTKPHTSCA
ncbi:UDP-glycosyltransferase 91A1-like [Senna tora]|uniref:UDP-glycosyltransferase 91A1-like n=1 Tax=Senna tora TaxID=362788 RepID=A0A834WAD4_9FABA|nr:UDP-glycosyltransferase 91A1-like [Senna tora]